MNDTLDSNDFSTFVHLEALRSFVGGFIELKQETGHVLLDGVSQDLSAARMFISSVSKPGMPADQTAQILEKVQGLLDQSLLRCRHLLDYLDSLDVSEHELNQMIDFTRLAAYSNIAKTYEATLLSLARAIEERNQECAGHTERVTRLATRLASRMGMAAEDLVNFRFGAMLHDVGKLGVPEQILAKTDSLDAAEWAVLRRHPELARQWLGGIPYLARALDVPVAYHERWDGSGYPKGLRGEQIPLGARIFAVVDVWDGLLHACPKRSAWPVARAVDYVRKNSGVQFDPLVVKEFLEMIREENQHEDEV